MTPQDHILPTVNRIEALFKEEDLGNYYLSMQIGERNFAYCILDSVTNKYIGIGDLRLPATKSQGELEIKLSFDAFLTKVLTAFPVLKKKFKSAKMIWEGNKSTLVPESLFEENDRQKILAFNVPLDLQEKVFHDLIPDFQAVNVYAMPEKVKQVLTRAFAVNHFPHLTSVLIESIFQNYRAELNQPKVFLHVRETHFDLVVMDQNKLYFSNTFEFRRPEDLVYYTIFTLEQLGLSQEMADVILFGRIARNTPLYHLIGKYLPRIEFARRNPGYTYSFVFNEIPQHAYFPLLNLNQCGL
ncbi:MAG: DUF3822 family protein [Bacteroidales bacterium]|nr:DUF3822 family protein [Bacteroidales bacterium]